ncbi:MAG: hypothetical protein AABM42_12405 [Actinomycetota bacterium]
MLGGAVIGLAVIGLAALLRAGPPAWIGLIVAMLVFSNDPNEGPGALAVGAGVWIVLRYLRGSRA